MPPAVSPGGPPVDELDRARRRPASTSCRSSGRRSHDRAPVLERLPPEPFLPRLQLQRLAFPAVFALGQRRTERGEVTDRVRPITPRYAKVPPGAGLSSRQHLSPPRDFPTRTRYRPLSRHPPERCKTGGGSRAAQPVADPPRWVRETPVTCKDVRRGENCAFGLHFTCFSGGGIPGTAKTAGPSRPARPRPRRQSVDEHVVVAEHFH